jgi:hypothetical protein
MKAPANPRTYVPATRKKDLLIAAACALVVLALIIFGAAALMKHQRAPSRNNLTGTIVEKYHTGEREKEITFGRKGLKGQETDAGFRFLIRVEKEGRTFEVPVTKQLFDTKNVGDTQSFIRPPSEQR